MSLPAETKEAVRSLGLSAIPLEWVDTVWEDNFCESCDLPAELLFDSAAWSHLVGVCRQWKAKSSNGGDSGEDSDNQAEDGVGFWTTLLDADLSHRTLMSVVYCILERSKPEPIDRLCAVLAAQLYLALIQLPGSGAFKIFHPMIFQKSLDVFYLYPDTACQSGKASVSGGRRGKRKREQLLECEDGGRCVVEGGEGEVKALLKEFIKDIYMYLQDHTLSEHEASRYHLAQVLLRMCRTEVSTRPSLDKDSLSSSVLSDGPMCVWGWRSLVALCQTRHGSLEKVVSEVFRQVLPCLLMLTSEGGVTTSTPLPSHLTAPSHDALTFVCHISELYNETVLGPLKNLIQHICTKVPDRAEYRNKMAVVVCRLLSLFPDKPYSQLLNWLYKLSRNTKVGYRVLILEIVNELIGLPLRRPAEGELDGEDEYRLGLKFLMRIILSRCSDKAPSVCGRALSCLAYAAGSSSVEVVEAVRKSVLSRTTVDPLVATPSSSIPGRPRNSDKATVTFLQKAAWDRASNESIVVQMVRRRTTHDKVGVRRAAILALEALVRLDTNTKREDVIAIHERCLDPALSVRKQALTSLTTLLLDRKHCTIIHSYWLDGVLPMVLDREASAQEKCLQILEDIILRNITALERSTTDTHRFVWHLLSLIASGDRLDWRRYLYRALEHWSRSGKLTETLVKDVCTHASAENKEHEEAAWMFLAGISEFSSAVDMGFIIDNWKCRDTFVSMETDSPLVQLLVVIGNQAKHLGKIAIQDIKDDTLMMLASFKLRPTVIQSAMHTLCRICTALTPQKQYQTTLNTWCVPLLQSCEAYLSKMVQQEREDSIQDGGKESSNWNEQSEKEAVRYLFTLGEIAHLCPGHTSHHVGLMVQSVLLASSELTNHDGIKHSDTSDSSVSGQLSGLAGLNFSPALRGHAYVTLGKMCLHNEELTKKSVVQMARELETSKHHTIRNNLIIILCDLAVRYSAKVDPYISTISACLRDESLVVRQQTLTLLACLLQEDYVKWKGSLFFRFVSSLVDPELKRFGEFCMVHLLLARHPAMFYQHFIECVFHFNGYEKHKVYNRFNQTEREKKLFCLKGAKNSSKRQSIYTFLLSHMTDEHRFQLTARLCQEVLGGIVDGAISLDDDSVGVVKDTLAILACKEIKLSTLRRNVGEELAEEGDQVGAAVATAQTKIISQIVKKNVIENLVPIVIAAKHLFEQKHSPLLRDMLVYLKELMQDYRHEISDVLSCDKQLAEEIEFDLKRFEEEQKKTAKTPAVVTPHAQMSSPLLSPVVMGSAVATVTATPPKLRTPARGSPWKPRNTPTLTAKMKTPFKVHMAMSPLVMVQRLGNANKPLQPHTPSTRHPSLIPQPKQDVSSPVAARARVNSINMDFLANVHTPVVGAGRQPQTHVPLQRAVLLSTARRTGQRVINKEVYSSHTPTTPTDPDQTQLPGRAASTPEGLGEAVSFNVSSLIPPSPIPPNTTLTSYTASQGTGTTKTGRKSEANMNVSVNITKVDVNGRGYKRAKRSVRGEGVKVVGGGGPVVMLRRKGADIMMSSPDNEPKKLDKWRVKLK